LKYHGRHLVLSSGLEMSKFVFGSTSSNGGKESLIKTSILDCEVWAELRFVHLQSLPRADCIMPVCSPPMWQVQSMKPPATPGLLASLRRAFPCDYFHEVATKCRIKSSYSNFTSHSTIAEAVRPHGSRWKPKAEISNPRPDEIRLHTRACRSRPTHVRRQQPQHFRVICLARWHLGKPEIYLRLGFTYSVTWAEPYA
jgi:hypothetical protein